MTHRPSTARSEISSAISSDGLSSRPPSGSYQQPSLPTAPVSQHGYAHLKGVAQPPIRAVRSPPPQMMNATTRPQSPEIVASRTHVPSVTAQGFLRPMSSTRLQAQRPNRSRAGGRTYSPSPASDGVASDFDDSQSMGSHRTGPYASLPRSKRIAPSVTTGYTGSEAAGDHESEYRAHNSERGQGQFAGRPHSNQKSIHNPLSLDLSSPPHMSSTREQPVKSPRSFRSGFSIGSKQLFQQGHQHLSSVASSPRLQQQEEHAQKQVAIQSALGKNYEYFEGNTVFWMGGRFQNARDRPINIATGMLMVLPAVLFFVFSASWLWHHVSPAIPIVFAYLFFICFSSFIHASLTNPGIYPRNLHNFPPDESNDPLAIGPATNDWVMVRLATSQTAAMDVPVKFCKTCNIWRPPRCYHCRVCDNCVDTLDHHCVWLNNCVGRRNYRYFFAFVSSGTLLALVLALGSLGHVIAYRDQENVSFGTAINRCRVPFAMFIYGILAFAYPSSLWVYHLMLTGRGETTREYLASKRFPKQERHRPFTLGNAFRNWIAVLVRPKPPTYLHFKEAYLEGDQRLGSARGQASTKSEDERQLSGMEMKPVKGPKSFEGPHGRTTKEHK